MGRWTGGVAAALMDQLHRPSTQPQRSRMEKHGLTSQVDITPEASATVVQTSPEQPAVAQSASELHSAGASAPSTRARHDA